jgi:DNA adenine methylase
MTIAALETKRQPIPFRYPGGKFYALGLLAPFWQTDHDEYREPFMGGGSVFFTKGKVKYNIINDLDSELITTYKALQDPQLREALNARLENEQATKERWREILNFEPKTPLDIAFKYFYLNRTSFSGKLTSPAWGYRDKRSLPPARWHERIIPCGIKLEGCDIRNEDFEKIISLPKKGKAVLMFVDPPYFSPAKKKHYRNGFLYEDHVRLMECLRKTKHNFFLTYDDKPEIRELYSWANIYEAKFFYRVENSETFDGLRKMGFELIITNYDYKKQLSAF